MPPRGTYSDVTIPLPLPFMAFMSDQITVLLFSSSLCASWHGSSLKTAYVVHSLRGMFLPLASGASNECIQKPPWVLLINDMPSDQERPPRWENHPAGDWVICISMVPNASTSSVHPRLCAGCVHLCYSSLVGCHTTVLPGAGTVYSDILGLIVLHVIMTLQIIRNLARYRVLWGSTLMVTPRMLTWCQLITKTIKSRRYRLSIRLAI